eukprot:CAMPEP_0184503170 /NCGR_PEP_ID=MMETSP0113_2-20130426/51732_1 /TAXON_ID=91329 /ORGANISM="Norrisiella sphaerica, Strain BC52" /LENGTH=327 /DNA_ID=CAMNT_0026892617 /DNA_START=975 /DNA_END=1958 /DNA_ORIENTATION=-
MRVLPCLLWLSAFVPASGAWRYLEKGSQSELMETAIDASQCLEAAAPRRVTPDSPMPMYLHIEKTGGTTLSIAIAQSFDIGQVSEKSCVSYKANFSAANNLETAEIGFGHNHPWEIVAYNKNQKARELTPITMLRDVVTHRKSFYLEKMSGIYATPKEWIKSKDYIKHYQMVNSLSTFGKTLKKNKREYCNMEYVAMSDPEKMEDALCLYSYKFQHRVELFSSYRVKPDEKRENGWDDETVKTVERIEADEIELVNFVSQIFDERLKAAKAHTQQMIADGQEVGWLCSKWGNEFNVKTTTFAPKLDARKQELVCGLKPEKWCPNLCW